MLNKAGGGSVGSGGRVGVGLKGEGGKKLDQG